MATLLEAVREAADELRLIEEDRAQARAKLRAAIERAAEEGIALARIGREAGLSRQAVRLLLGRR